MKLQKILRMQPKQQDLQEEDESGIAKKGEPKIVQMKMERKSPEQINFSAFPLYLFTSPIPKNQNTQK